MSTTPLIAPRSRLSGTVQFCVAVSQKERQTLKRVLMLLVAAVSSMFASAVLLGASPMSAAPYPPTAATVVTDSGTYGAGSPVTITARRVGGCVEGIVTFTITPPGGGEPIVVTAPLQLTGTIDIPASVAVDAFDSATVTIVAGNVNGDYTVTASCASLVTTTSFAVRLLPATGSVVDLPLQAAAVLIFVGAMLLMVALRRRPPATSVR